MATERRIRAIVQLKLKARLLPREQAGKMWAGPGDNEVCDVCDEKVTKKQTVYEWESNGGKIHMHIDCYTVWNELRSRRRS